MTQTSAPISAASRGGPACAVCAAVSGRPRGGASARRRRARGRRPARSRARLGIRASARPVDRLALLPVHEHGAGDEDRRVGARERADEQREGEVLQRLAAEQEQREHRQASCRRLVASERTMTSRHRAVDDLRERGARHPRDVLPDAVEHDDRVVEREAQDGEQRRDRRRRHLPAGEGVDARRDQDVVHQRDQHRHGELPLEAQRDVDRDDGQRGDDRGERRVRPRSGRRSAPIDL